MKELERLEDLKEEMESKPTKREQKLFYFKRVRPVENKIFGRYI